MKGRGTERQKVYYKSKQKEYHRFIYIITGRGLQLRGVAPSDRKCNTRVNKRSLTDSYTSSLGGAYS